MATHSSVLALRIPGMGEPGGLPSMGLHRVGHDWSNLAAAAAAYCYNVTCGFLILVSLKYVPSIPIFWRFLSWKDVIFCQAHSLNLLVTLRFSLSYIYGTPLQYSCLENPMDGGAWWAAVLGSLRVGHDWATSLSLSCIGEGNGNPLQCSCLENPRDGGAWWGAVSGVSQSRTQLKRLSSSSVYVYIYIYI